MDSIDFILKMKQTNAIWVNSLQTGESRTGNTTSFRTPRSVCSSEAQKSKVPHLRSAMLPPHTFRANQACGFTQPATGVLRRTLGSE